MKQDENNTNLKNTNLKNKSAKSNNLKSDFNSSTFEEEFIPTEKIVKRNIREQIKTLKLITNINEIQRIIDYFEFNKKGFSENFNYMLNSSSCDYNHNYLYLKYFFKAKLIELYILIIKNYLEVNKFTFSIDKTKELRNIINKLLNSYIVSHKKEQLGRLKR